MTQTGYANAIVDAMLSWLKGLASWVLRLFNLSGGFSPLKFLADNWLQLLIILLIAGVVLDIVIWLIRWRPHWVWFRKRRVIINDKNFFARENYIDDEDEEDDEWSLSHRASGKKNSPRPRRNWEDSEFVVPGATRRRREEQLARRGQVKSMQVGRSNPEEPTDVFRDGLFNVNAKQKFSDKYEDEVFSVSNLPKPERPVRPGQEKRKPAGQDRRRPSGQPQRKRSNTKPKKR